MGIIGHNARLKMLTDHERNVLALMAAGRSNGAIAERLVVSEGAVEKHVSSIFAKFGLRLPTSITAVCWPS